MLLPALLKNFDRPTDQSTNQPTDQPTDEVTFPKCLDKNTFFCEDPVGGLPR